jgi:hypothetical protein
MADLLKLLLPVFLSPTNYSEMLKKLGSFLFYETWLATFFLRQIEPIGAFFRSIESSPPVLSVISLIPGYDKLNLTGLVIALFVAGVSYAAQLHDRISDLFGIRHRFDLNYILLPLAQRVRKRATPRLREAMSANRDPLMRAVFYRYASSRSDKVIVDKHDIERALDGWSWYWILIEAMPLTLVGGIASAIFGARGEAVGFFGVFICLLFLAWLFNFKLRRLALPQIDTIAADTKASAAVKKEFDAL